MMFRMQCDRCGELLRDPTSAPVQWVWSDIAEREAVRDYSWSRVMDPSRPRETQEIICAQCGLNKLTAAIRNLVMTKVTGPGAGVKIRD